MLEPLNRRHLLEALRPNHRILSTQTTSGPEPAHPTEKTTSDATWGRVNDHADHGARMPETRA